MDALFIEVAKQVPALGVLVYVVIVFLAHIAQAADRAEQRDAARDRVIENVGEKLERTAEALGQSTLALARSDQLAENLARIIERLESRPSRGDDRLQG